MTRLERKDFETKLKNEVTTEKIKTAIWGLGTLDVSISNQLKYINNGLLGFELNKDGTEAIDKVTEQKIPITISRATYFRYKKQFEEIPQVYLDLKETTDEGYAKKLLGAQKLLELCLKMSGENLFAENLTPMQSQHIIDSIVNKVLPAKTTIDNFIKRLTDKEKLKPRVQ